MNLPRLPHTRPEVAPAGCRRRHWLGLGLALVGARVVQAAPPAVLAGLPPPGALDAELAQALRHREPLVVMVSLPGCPFCRVAREHYLAPLRAEGQPIVQVDMRSDRPVTDFQGQPQTHDQLVHRWGVSLAPTVLFFGSGGAEVAERLVGGYLPDFYGAYLDQRLEQARHAVRG